MKINYILLKLKSLKERSNKIEQMLFDTNILTNKQRFSSLFYEYTKLNDICTCLDNLKKIELEIQKTKLLKYDSEFYLEADIELKQLNLNKKKIEYKLNNILFSDHAKNSKSCFLEIRAGTGGDEASIFALDLFKMYKRYAEINNWTFNTISSSPGCCNGYKEIIVNIIGTNAYNHLRFESGGHRVQRVPETESRGRIHTSSCTVAVMPDVPRAKQPNINIHDLKIETFRSSGAGGQHVNTTDSAVRITHLPSGIIAECQDERSQHKNKSRAMEVLLARIYNAELKRHNTDQSNTRRILIGSGDRYDRSRTYNFIHSRVTDHRINKSFYCLDDILKGKLNIVIDDLIKQLNNDELSKLL